MERTDRTGGIGQVARIGGTRQDSQRRQSGYRGQNCQNMTARKGQIGQSNGDVTTVAR
jgi:hypothetical protein